MKRFVFDINSTPPTREQLRQAARVQQDQAESVLGLIGVGCLLATGYVLVSGTLPVGALIGCFAVLTAVMLVHGFGLTASAEYQTVSSRDRARLLLLSAATPEGRAYRAGVERQGRDFVLGEYWAIIACARSELVDTTNKPSQCN